MPTVLAGLVLLLSLSLASDCRRPSTTIASSFTYVTAQSVHDALVVGEGLKSVQPYPKDCLTGTCEWYLNDYSCLGPFGPPSAYGPLGMIGPLGASEYARDLSLWSLWVREKKVMISLPVAMSNPSNVVNQSEPTSWLDWANLSEKVSHGGGPLSYYGPLGPYGPLGDAYTTIMPKINDFAAHLAAQGVWTVLGPLGPFGPLGYMIDKFGNYIDSHGDIARNYSVPWSYANGQSIYRTYDLVEEYQPDYVRALTDNDCSWMTHSAGLVLMGDTEQYAFTSAEEQYVTVLVVPQYQLDDFDLQVTIDGAQVITSANPGSSFVDWVQVKVRAGARLVAKVELSLTVPFSYWSHDYRLYVVGSTSAFTSSPISGPHIIRY